MMTFLAPRTASKVLRMSSSRACTSTCTVTSSGMCPPSIKVRKISYSVSEAEGKPTSISLKPTSTRVWKNFSFSSMPMGVTRAWLPSRRSTLHQIGALVMILSGHWRSGRLTRWKGTYFFSCCISCSSFLILK